MNTLANNIRELRRHAGMTQEALAQTLHVTRQAISNWEKRMKKNIALQLKKTLAKEPMSFLVLCRKLLVHCLGSSHSDSNSSAHHGVVAHAQEA